jgi:hypothetical protein
MTWRFQRVTVATSTEEVRMHARVAAFENRDMSRIDELIAQVSRRIAEGRQPPGDGFLMLIDRQGGRALGVTLFDDLAALEAAEPEFERMGDEIPEEIRGRRVSRDVYEVAFAEFGAASREKLHA